MKRLSSAAHKTIALLILMVACVFPIYAQDARTSQTSAAQPALETLSEESTQTNADSSAEVKSSPPVDSNQPRQVEGQFAFAFFAKSFAYFAVKTEYKENRKGSKGLRKARKASHCRESITIANSARSPLIMSQGLRTFPLRLLRAGLV